MAVAALTDCFSQQQREKNTFESTKVSIRRSLLGSVRRPATIESSVVFLRP